LAVELNSTTKFTVYYIGHIGGLYYPRTPLKVSEAQSHHLTFINMTRYSELTNKKAFMQWLSTQIMPTELKINVDLLSVLKLSPDDA